MHVNIILIIGSLISFFLVILTMPSFIKYIKKIKFGQFIRADGPREHLKKEGTPSMGGIIFILATLAGFLTAIIFLEFEYPMMVFYRKVTLLVLPFIAFGFLGFFDDYLIVLKKNNKGLSGSLKFLYQVIIAAVFFFIFLALGFTTEVNFFNFFTVDLWFLYGLLILFILTGSSNAVNLTDGLDGLATGTMLIALSFFLYVAHLRGELIIMAFIIALMSALIGFLFFNYKPAKIFMGDTGSLALGSILATLAIMLKVEVFLIIIAIPFILETLSVVVQVFYFKRTKGKRLFLMAPLHHHFELKGYSEKKVVWLFYSITFIALVVSLFVYRAVYI